MSNLAFSVLIGLFLFAKASTTNLDESLTVYINPSSSAFIQISCTPSTGFHWFVISPNSIKISVTDLSGIYTPPTKDSVGARGFQTFEIVCNDLCTNGDYEELVLFKGRNWDVITPDIIVIAIIVTTEPQNESSTP
ncbi:hypothetical protein SteCoe_33246 [Stentor coeruleus]|uniref:Proteinase inhibitor I42 chagasin domain-containing protein n=1 Tax=Stentor coeruleus TaxID=5963 RepID=A0A1R2AX78_9CILI|nr:hypothetical protein SteCoe_33246 [Stentor coeruleus]